MGRVVIEGVVDAANQAVVGLVAIGARGRRREIDVVIDTGFTGYLTLPPELVSELGLASAGNQSMILADGSFVYIEAFHAAIVWDGTAIYVRASVTDNAPTIGMSLLDGYDLFIQVREGGRVLIRPSAH